MNTIYLFIVLTANQGNGASFESLAVKVKMPSMHQCYQQAVKAVKRKDVRSVFCASAINFDNKI